MDVGGIVCVVLCVGIEDVDVGVGEVFVEGVGEYVVIGFSEMVLVMWVVGVYLFCLVICVCFNFLVLVSSFNLVECYLVRVWMCFWLVFVSVVCILRMLMMLLSLCLYLC